VTGTRPQHSPGKGTRLLPLTDTQQGGTPAQRARDGKRLSDAEDKEGESSTRNTNCNTKTHKISLERTVLKQI